MLFRSAVVGKQDEDELIKPLAFIVLKKDAKAPTLEELRAFLKGKLAGYKVPHWLEVVAELPKTATGKIQRFKLRA